MLPVLSDFFLGLHAYLRIKVLEYIFLKNRSTEVFVFL